MPLPTATAVLVDDERNCLRGFFWLLLGEYYGLAEILARRVYHRHLATGADARIDRENGLLAQGARQKQMAEVLGENLHGGAIGGHLLFDGDIYLAARGEQPLVGVFGGEPDLGARLDAGGFFDKCQHVFDHGLWVENKLHPENALLLPPSYREVAVARDCRDGLFKVVVLVELGRF